MTERTRSATEQLSDDALARPRPVRVEATAGPGAGAVAQLSVGLLVVGSHRDCDLVLADGAVSRQHASLELLEGCVRVRDLGSRNGTTYLNARVSEARVPVGASLTVGRTTLLIRPLEDQAEVSPREELHGLVARSLPMRRLFAELERVGPGEATVLIRGETGVGKEAVARAIHGLSPRAPGPLVVFDCAAQGAELLESALFGHLKGAFTGATTTQAGAVQEAALGTLLLDSVGELPLELQPKLLRLLESHELRAVGGNTSERVDVRLLASTTRDLRTEVAAGRFRQDLYYRLAVIELEVPPLRERPEDVPLLAAHFARLHSGHALPLGPATLALMQNAAWPGNVRELRNAVQRALALGREDPFASGRDPDPAKLGFKDARSQLIERFERDYLVALMEAHRGNVSAAARAGGISRMTMYRLLERHGIGAPQ